MRIIGGTLSGRKIEPPLSLTTRPMMDRIRQALFNILAHHDWGKSVGNILNETYVLDAFCGTGALAYEAISWGAKQATLFDKDRRSYSNSFQERRDTQDKRQMSYFARRYINSATAFTSLSVGFFGSALPQAIDTAGVTGAGSYRLACAPCVDCRRNGQKEVLDLPAGFETSFSRFYGDTGLHFILRMTV